MLRWSSDGVRPVYSSTRVRMLRYRARRNPLPAARATMLR